MKAALMDERTFVVGEVYYIVDELLNMPATDRAGTRTLHEGRRVVIAHNCELNADPTWPLIYVAPLSSRVELASETDIVVRNTPEDGDGVSCDSIVELALVQPVLKTDLERRTGALSKPRIAEIIALQEDMLTGHLRDSGTPSA